MRSLAPVFTFSAIHFAEIDQRAKGLLLLSMWSTNSMSTLMRKQWRLSADQGNSCSKQLIFIWRWVCGNVIIAVQMSQWDLIIISWVISHVVICPETAACLSPKCILSVRVWPYMEVNSTDTILVLVNVCHHYYKFCGRRGYWHSQPPWSRAQPSMSPGIKLHWEGRGWARDYHHPQAINHWIVLTHTHVHTL